MHLDDGLLEALLDGELRGPAVAEARRHVDACSQCRGELEHLRRDGALLDDALRSLDHPAPRIPLAGIATRARQRRRPRRWAAAIALLLVTAGTAYALPGSPVRRWIDQLVGRPARNEATPAPDVAGVAVAPGRHFSVVFTAPRAPGSLTITLTDSAAISVRRRGGQATFNAELERLRIETGTRATDFEVAIPRDAVWVEVVVEGRRVFLKDGARVITEMRPDSKRRYIF
jgi:hypothetical protein